MRNHAEGYKGATVLITGGAGCIGSNITLELCRMETAKIIVLDDLSAAARWNVPFDSRVRFIKGSVTDLNALNAAFEHKPQIVIHLAAHFANQNSIDHPKEDLMVNGMGTYNVLQFAHKHKAERVVYASSGCSVYGSQHPLPLTEDMMSLNLDTPYQIHKLLGELYCNFFHRHYGLPVATARYFNVYGPGEIPGQYRNVIPVFLWEAIHGRPLVVTGDGSETRDFTYVDNIVDGTLRLGVMQEAAGDAFNLASGIETSVTEIATIVNKVAGNEGNVQYTARRDWDKITKRRASIDKAREVLGYAPTNDMEDGIRQVYDWIIANRDAIVAYRADRGEGE